MTAKPAQQNDDVIRPDKIPAEADQKGLEREKFWPQSSFPSITLTTF